jgi:hypothetical protein
MLSFGQDLSFCCQETVYTELRVRKVIRRLCWLLRQFIGAPPPLPRDTEALCQICQMDTPFPEAWKKFTDGYTVSWSLKVVKRFYWLLRQFIGVPPTLPRDTEALRRIYSWIHRSPSTTESSVIRQLFTDNIQLVCIPDGISAVFTNKWKVITKQL